MRKKIFAVSGLCLLTTIAAANFYSLTTYGKNTDRVDRSQGNRSAGANFRTISSEEVIDYNSLSQHINNLETVENRAEPIRKPAPRYHFMPSLSFFSKPEKKIEPEEPTNIHPDASHAKPVVTARNHSETTTTKKIEQPKQPIVIATIHPDGNTSAKTEKQTTPVVENIHPDAVVKEIVKSDQAAKAKLETPTKAVALAAVEKPHLAVEDVRHDVKPQLLAHAQTSAAKPVVLENKLVPETVTAHVVQKPTAAKVAVKQAVVAMPAKESVSPVDRIRHAFTSFRWSIPKQETHTVTFDKIIKRDVTFDRFDKIDIEAPVNVFITNTDQLANGHLEGHQSVLDRMTMSVSDGVLKIRFNGQNMVGTATVMLNVNHLVSLRVRGSAPVNAHLHHIHNLDLDLGNRGPVFINGNDIGVNELHLSGSGDVKISGVESNNMNIDGTGSSSVWLRGESRVHDIHFAGDGHYYFYWVSGDYVHVTGSGSATFEVAGKVTLLETELHQTAHLDARYLRADHSLVKTFDASQADIQTLHRQFALAQDSSNIYYYNSPPFAGSFMQRSGSVLAMVPR